MGDRFNAYAVSSGFTLRTLSARFPLRTRRAHMYIRQRQFGLDILIRLNIPSHPESVFSRDGRMGIKFPDRFLRLGKFRRHFRPLNVTRQAFRHNHANYIGMTYFFALCGPQLQNIVSRHSQHFSSQDHYQAIFALGQADNIQIFAGLRQQIPIPAFRNTAFYAQFPG